MNTPRLQEILAAGLAVVLTACVSAGAPTPSEDAAPTSAAEGTPSGDGPRLVLFLVVDQMRADYLERFSPLFQYGLRRLLDESVVFTDAHHDHALTLTAPGHATLSTGCHPSRHGVIGNWWWDREAGEQIAAVDDPQDDDEKSPRRLLCTTLGDWLKAVSPSSKVFAASAKDRGAIFTAGHKADGAYWYDGDEGSFPAETYYYKDAERPWLDAFNDRDILAGLFGRPWEPLPETFAALLGHGLRPVHFAPIPKAFPHPLGGVALTPGESFYGAVYGTPFVDAHLGAWARAAIEGEDLGKDDAVDFLGLSFSALDAVGHTFGPSSPEVLDTLLRLDRTLGLLLSFIDERVGLEHVVVSLSSDHGVTPVPELMDGGAGRFGTAEITCFQAVQAKLRQRFGEGDWVEGGFCLDHELIEQRGHTVAEFEAVLKEELRACRQVAEIWTRSELLAGPDDPIGQLYAHSLHAEISCDIVLQADPHVLTHRSTLANHGSPYAYDTHVPWLLRLPSGKASTVSERVHTVDVAPTVAHLVGLAPPEAIDGVDRSGLFGPAEDD